MKRHTQTHIVAGQMMCKQLQLLHHSNASKFLCDKSYLHKHSGRESVVYSDISLFLFFGFLVSAFQGHRWHTTASYLPITLNTQIGLSQHGDATISTNILSVLSTFKCLKLCFKAQLKGHCCPRESLCRTESYTLYRINNNHITNVKVQFDKKCSQNCFKSLILSLRSLEYFAIL